MSDGNEPKKPSKRLGRISARTGKPISGNTESSSSQSSGRHKQDEVFNAAERAAEFFDHLRAHYRKSKRSAVDIEATIKVLLMDGTVYDEGSAGVVNVSPSGALLGRVKLPKNTWPLERFKLEVIMHGGQYEGIGIEARPVRFEHTLGGIGVSFVEIFVAV
jgi:hypothetical protein